MKPARKGQVRLHTQVDMEAIQKIKDSREEVEILPECFLTDEELGLEPLLHILPDTWQNISWVIKNSVEQLKDCSIQDRRAIEQIKDYSLRWNAEHLDNILMMLEKGNQVELKVMMAQENLEKRMYGMVNTNLSEMRGKILALETNQEKFQDMVFQRIETLQTTVDKMEEGHILRDFTSQEVEKAKQEAKEQIEELTNDIQEQFKNLINTHLVKSGTIGPTEKYKTLIEFSCQKIPEHQKRLKTFEEQQVKFTNIQTQFQGRLAQALGTDLPAKFKEIENDQKRFQVLFENHQEFMENKFLDLDKSLKKSENEQKQENIKFGQKISSIELGMSQQSTEIVQAKLEVQNAKSKMETFRELDQKSQKDHQEKTVKNLKEIKEKIRQGEMKSLQIVKNLDEKYSKLNNGMKKEIAVMQMKIVEQANVNVEKEVKEGGEAPQEGGEATKEGVEAPAEGNATPKEAPEVKSQQSKAKVQEEPQKTPVAETPRVPSFRAPSEAPAPKILQSAAGSQRQSINSQAQSQHVDIFAGVETINNSTNEDLDQINAKLDHLQKQIDDLKNEKIKMVNQAPTPTPSNKIESMIASRASFIKPKKSTFTVGEPTPKPSVDLEPILKTQEDHKEEISKLKDQVLKLTQKFKKIGEWKLEAQKDIPKLKKQMKIIFDEREKIETDLINSIMRSSQDSRDQMLTDEEMSFAKTPIVEKQEILPNLKKLSPKNGKKLKIRVENFETMSPRDISLPRLNFSTSKNDVLFSVRNHNLPVFENPISTKQMRVAKKRQSAVHQINSVNRKVKKNNLISRSPPPEEQTTTAQSSKQNHTTHNFEATTFLNTSYDKPSLKSIRSNARVVQQSQKPLDPQGLILIKNQWTEKLDENIDVRKAQMAQDADIQNIVVDRMDQRNSHLRSTWKQGYNRGSSLILNKPIGLGIPEENDDN